MNRTPSRLEAVLITLLLAVTAVGLSHWVGTGTITFALVAVLVSTARYGWLAGTITAAIGLAGQLTLEAREFGLVWRTEQRAVLLIVQAIVMIWVVHTLRRNREMALLNQQRLTLVVESMPDAFLLVDRTGKLLYMNGPASRLRNTTPEQLANQVIWDVDPMTRETPLGEALRKVLHLDQPQHFEYNSEGRWWTYDVYPAPGGVFAFGKDITERKRSEQALKEKELQLRVITDSSPALIAQVGEDLTYRFNNRVHRDWLGLDPATLAGQRLDQVHAEQWEEWKPWVEAALEGRTVNFEWRKRSSGPECRTFLTTLVPDQEDGTIQGFFALTTDISERKAAEQAAQKSAALLRDGERRFRAMFDQAAVGMAELDLNGRFMQVNQKYSSLFGYSPAELRQMTFIDLAPPEDRLSEALQFGRMASGEFGTFSGERRRVRKDGSAVWVNVSVALVKDDVGRPELAVALAEEITDRKALEQELAQYTSELARSNQELEQFAYAASHDLREPLRTVGTYIELIARRLRDRQDAEISSQFQVVQEAIHRMHALISALLTYSRIGQRNSRPLKPVNLDAVVKWVIMNLSQEINDASARVTADTLPQVMGDETQFVQLIQNLVSNAIKYRGPEAPRIHVWAEAKAKEWVISVRDNGSGIEKQYQEKIFGAFQRLHGRDIPGTGLGLAICQKIVERHGGRIWVESEPGAGSTFRFTLPM